MGAMAAESGVGAFVRAGAGDLAVRHVAAAGIFVFQVLERDDFSSNRHPALAFCLSMISTQTLRVCREGKPVPTLGSSPRACFSGSCSIRQSPTLSSFRAELQTVRHSHSRMYAITSPNSSKAADQTSADVKFAI